MQIPRFDGTRDRLFSRFTAHTLAGQWIGLPHAVELFENVSADARPIAPAKSIKGLQVQMADDAIALGVKHAVWNVDLGEILDPDPLADGYPWTCDGKIYRFKKSVIDRIPAKALTDANIQLTLILLAYAGKSPAIDVLTRHPRTEPSPPNGVVAFNTHSPEGMQAYRACIEFLADRYSGKSDGNGRVVGYIIGNEVNSHRFWYNLGNVPMEAVAEEYVKAVRVAYLAVRKSSAAAKVYINLDHFWAKNFDSNPLSTSGGKPFLDHFNRITASTGNYGWHLSHHPYPEDMRNPISWIDKQASHDPFAAWISYKNLEQLPKYMHRSELLYEGQPRRIILSEQGFDTPRSANGQILQAAGFCYAYRKALQEPLIDAFILHRHVDHGRESEQEFGLWTRKPGTLHDPLEQKKLYEVFLHADGPQRDAKFAFALPMIGIRTWEELKTVGR